MPEIRIAALNSAPELCAALGELLVEAVASGGSVGFMHPLAPEAAQQFWTEALASAEWLEAVRD